MLFAQTLRWFCSWGLKRARVFREVGAVPPAAGTEGRGGPWPGLGPDPAHQPQSLPERPSRQQAGASALHLARAPCVPRCFELTLREVLGASRGCSRFPSAAASPLGSRGRRGHGTIHTTLCTERGKKMVLLNPLGARFSCQGPNCSWRLRQGPAVPPGAPRDGAVQRPLALSSGKLICLRCIWVSAPSNCFLIEMQR